VSTSRPTLSLVLPIYNEEEVIPELHRSLGDFLAQLGLDAEVVFVDDGSKDRSLEMLRALAAEEPRYRVLSFARNFGHQMAITAGVDHAEGEAVVVMDADLQDPPEVVLEMVAKWREGFDVVYGRRRSRRGETWFKLLTARLFYRLFQAMIPIKVPLDTGDFRLMSRRVVLVLRELRETHRFVRGLVAWVGFKQTAVDYDRPGRFAGTTKYPLRKMARFAVDGITSFSMLPLRFSLYVGAFMSAGSVGIAAWALIAKYVMNRVVPGWTALVVVVAVFASAQFLMIGILGEYVGRIYEEMKRRPLYIVAEKIEGASVRKEVRPAMSPTGTP
jgi:dolichol-phosphate mannosyltransferase